MHGDMIVKENNFSKTNEIFLWKMFFTWIVDSGAMDHMMTHNTFISYNLCPINGYRYCSRWVSYVFEINNVLHLPKLSTNLISIFEETKDLNCTITFFPTVLYFSRSNFGADDWDVLWQAIGYTILRTPRMIVSGKLFLSYMSKATPIILLR